MKILISCNAGMSSSILVRNIRNYAESIGQEIEVKASPSSGIIDEVGKWDVCLVAPQLVYAVDRIKKQLNIPVVSIPPVIYAAGNGEEAYKLALSQLEEE